MFDYNYEKQPAEQETITISWATRIAGMAISGFVISAVAVVIKDAEGVDVSASMIEGVPSFLTTNIYVTIKGGTDGEDYTATFSVTLSKGGEADQVQEDDLLIQVREISATTAGLLVTDSTLASFNSYVTVAEVDAYCQQMGYTSWADLSTLEKEQAILRGMIYIDSLDYKGDKTYFTNPLAWPRVGVYSDSISFPDTYTYYTELSITEIPNSLKRGTCQAAYEESISAGILLPTLSSNVKREKVDVLEIEYFKPDGASNQAVFSRILALMKDILNMGSGFAKVRRT
jgi:hypothetical protein